MRQVGIHPCSGKLTWFYIAQNSATSVDVVSMYRLVRLLSAVATFFHRSAAEKQIGGVIPNADSLMKIMRGHGSFADRKDLHTRGFHRNHVVDILEPAFDQQKFPSDHGETVLTK